MKLIATGNKNRRFFYILNKDKTFFSLFPKFLIGCGFKDLGVYEDYQEKIPNINNIENEIEDFKNENYDIDVIYTNNRIILIIRTDEKNRDNLISGIRSMTSHFISKKQTTFPK